MTEERRRRLHGLERRLGYRFSDLELLDRALTHASRANEESEPGRRDNEALEFLGDAVLGLVVTDLLHLRDPDGAEGPKSRRRARLVSGPSLARRAADLELPDMLLLGRGEEKTGGRSKKALAADAYEALVAALYLDGGFEVARRFLRGEFERDLERDEGAEDAKSALQELLQGQGRSVPAYRVTEESGPSHRRRFLVECRLEGDLVTEGEGSSKKAAQQRAAQRALELLRGRGA